MRDLAIRFVLILTCMSQGQGQTQSPSTTTKKPDVPELGLILTSYEDLGTDFAHLRHLPMIPGYQNWSGIIPGIAFENPYVKLFSVDVDYRKKLIYVYDEHYRSLLYGVNYNAALDLTKMTFDYLHIGVSRGQVQIAVDWRSHTVYWTDSVFKWIVAAAGLPDKINNDLYKIIVDTNLDAPDGIAVDPVEGLLFWSDVGRGPKIERSDLTGNGRRTIVTSGLVSPMTLETDRRQKRLFWIDAFREEILSVTYDGDDKQILKRISNALLWDLAIFRDIVVVTDIRNSETMFFNATIGSSHGKKESMALSIFPEDIYAVAAYFEEEQPLANRDHCAILDCDHLCLTNRVSAVCVCSEGFQLNNVNNKCEEVAGMYHKAVVMASTTHICLTDLRITAYPVYQVDCVYTVVESPPQSVRRRRRQATGTTAPTTVTTTTKNSTSSSTFVPTRLTLVPSPTTPAPTAAPGDLISFIEVNAIERVIYFADVSNRIWARPVDLPITDKSRDLLVAARGPITGLAFDWLDRNLYWCERGGDVHLVSVRERGVRLVGNTGDSPANLVIFPHDRSLVWSTSDAIKSMPMDGSSTPKVLVPNAKSPKYISVDTDSKVVYWLTSDNLLMAVPVGGGTPQTLLTLNNGTYVISAYKDYIKWLYDNPDVNSVNYGSYNAQVRTPMRGQFEIDAIDMKVLDATLQKKETSPCAHLNGGCEQICVTHHTDSDTFTKRCECTHGYTLAADQSLCTSDIAMKDNFLLVSDRTLFEIQQIELNTQKIHTLPREDSFDPRGIFFDAKTSKVYWSEDDNSIVFESNLNGTEQRAFADIGFGTPARFARDETTGIMYYTASDWAHIGMITKSGEVFELDEAFLFEAMGSIAVHPQKGWMYFTVDDSRFFGDSYVARADMDGKNKRELITKANGSYVIAPDGLCIDYIHERFFWSDRQSNIIQECNLEATKCTTIVNKTGEHAEIRDLATDGTLLYYTDSLRDHVVTINLDTLAEGTLYGEGLGRLESLSLYRSDNPNTQPVATKCAARGGLGDCSDICVPVSRDAGRVCMCERGVNLKGDGRTCANAFQCAEFIKQENGVTVTFEYDKCLRHLGETCKIVCPVNFEPVNANLEHQTCGRDGWSGETEILCIEKKCPAVVPNAILNNCDRKPGNKCQYACVAGFQATYETAICMNNGEWNVDPKYFCQRRTCSSTIDFGTIDSNCNRSSGSECAFQCASPYQPVDKLRGRLKCGSDGKWEFLPACELARCPLSFVAGDAVLDTSCTSTTVGGACPFTCPSGQRHLVDKVVCRSDQNWYPENPCEEMTASVASASTGSGGGISKVGAGVGFAVLAVIVVALIVLLVIFLVIRRRRGDSPYTTASYHNGRGKDGVAIENPGYMQTLGETPTPGRRTAENPYSSVDVAQMQPVTFDPLPSNPGNLGADDDGFFNPLYRNQASLAEVAHVDITHEVTADDKKLTNDSWLKEQSRKK